MNSTFINKCILYYIITPFKVTSSGQLHNPDSPMNSNDKYKVETNYVVILVAIPVISMHYIIHVGYSLVRYT